MAALIATEQLPVPVQAPLQPTKVEPEAGVAVNVTMVPLLKLALQMVGQLIPVGLLVTAPLPVPVRVSVSGKEVAPKPRSQMPRPWVDARSMREGLSNVNPRTATRGNPFTKEVQLIPPLLV